jgi:hypothetical protein
MFDVLPTLSPSLVEDSSPSSPNFPCFHAFAPVSPDRCPATIRKVRRIVGVVFSSVVVVRIRRIWATEYSLGTVCKSLAELV